MQQSKIHLDIKDKIVVNDKTLDGIIDKMDSFSSAFNNQLEYNKNIEAKIAQLAVALLVATNPKQVRCMSHPYFKNKIGCIKDSYVPQKQSHT